MVPMTSEEEIRCQDLRKLILANEPDNEYKFEISPSSYDQLKVEFGKADEDDSYPRLFYDWTRQVVTIVTVPTWLHEDTTLAILSGIFNSAGSLMQREGISLGPGQKLGWSLSPTILINDGRRKYNMQPDGVIFFKTAKGRELKVVIEVGISQTNDSLLEKARKWIFDANCTIVLLLAFSEKGRYSAPLKPISLTSQEMDDQIEQMQQRWLSTNISGFGPLTFKGHTWLDEISEGFIDVVRKGTESGRTDVMVNMKYILIDNGIDSSCSVPRSIGDMRLAELIRLESPGSSGDAADVIIDFFNSDSFMHIVRDAMIETAVNRFGNAVKLIA
ncbi:hypothetical protein V1517DRAFT_320706 [Lipomyces orientalis]|uniref:Uncharacterized protein n=1 Tax=Lipomyces orientalis TaxID=1233043 RepID=A0ACC3TQD9_9ASCO